MILNTFTNLYNKDKSEFKICCSSNEALLNNHTKLSFSVALSQSVIINNMAKFLG